MDVNHAGKDVGQEPIPLTGRNRPTMPGAKDALAISGLSVVGYVDAELPDGENRAIVPDPVFSKQCTGSLKPIN